MKPNSPISNFIKSDPADRPFIIRIMLRAAQFTIKVFIKFFQDRCFPRAAGLAFSTLLAIVPLLAVVFGFGGGLESVETSVQEFLAKTLLPTRQEVILNALTDFTENSRRLGTWGLLIFSVTVVFLLNNIENHFNAIFRSRKNPNILFRFTVYLSSLILGSLFVGASLSMTSNIISFLTKATMEMMQPFVVQAGLSLLSVLFMTIIIMVLISLMPTAKIRFSSALVGAIVGAVIWEIAKQLFSFWANISVRNSVIYGSLFLLPIMLLWVYIGWAIILFSLETAFVHQHKTLPLSITGNLSVEEPYGWIVTGLAIYLYICDVFMKKDKPPTINVIGRHFSLPERTISQIVTLMEDNQLLYTVQKRQKGYIPVSNLDQIEVREIMAVLSGYQKEVRVPVNNQSLALIEHLADKVKKPLEGMTIADTLKGKLPD